MKYLLLVPIICLCLQDVRAQEEVETTSQEAKKKVVAGIRAGIVNSNVYDRQGEEFVADGKTGLSAGGYLALPLGSLLGVQPEVILMQKGFEGAGKTGGEQYYINRTTTNLDIPLQLMIKPFKWFTFLIGPQYSFILNQKDNYTYANSAQKTSLTTSDRNQHVGTLTGVDLNFSHVVLSFRSGWDLSKNTNTSNPSVPTYRNRWVQWTIGYRFY